jgi:prevent-host-death family protein
MKTIGASEFKTHCLSLLDEVSAGETVLILKRGRPIARVVPVQPVETSPQMSLRGTVVAADDLIAPPLDPEAWEALS